MWTPTRHVRLDRDRIINVGDLTDEKKSSLGPLLLVASLVAAPFILLSTFSGMSRFDDEGTFLVGFRSMLEGHRMYDDIYSLYGPLYNAVYGLVYVVLRVPLTHSAGRLIAAALWFAYTAGFAAFCYRLTRSVSVTLYGYLLVLIFLTPLMDSPGHPEEMCLLLLATILLLVCSIERAPGFAAFAGIGMAVAALALVKINIGAYVGGGLVLVLLRVTTPTVWTRLAIPAMVVVLLLLPVAVQALLFDFEWARSYSLFSVLAIGAALLVVLNVQSQVITRPMDWCIIAVAGVSTCLVVIGGMMLAGSTAHAILQAVLLQNARFIRNWYLPLPVELPGLLAATVSVLAALLFCVCGSRPHLHRYRDLSIVALKFGFVLVGVILFVSPYQVFRTLVSFCWLLMVPPAGTQPRHATARAAAGLIGAIMSLYPFPVAGHQLNIGALLPVLMLPILAHDVLSALHWAGRRLTTSHFTFLAVIIVLAIGSNITLLAAREYWRSVPLMLPGTGLIRIDQEQTDDLRWVTEQLSSCTSSYSMPGMLSFTLWAGHDLPTTLNVNDVLAFIEPEQQERIVLALSRQPGLCVVYNPSLLLFFDRGQIRTDPPLLRYLNADFTPAAERHGYVILKRRGLGF